MLQTLWLWFRISCCVNWDQGISKVSLLTVNTEGLFQRNSQLFGKHRASPYSWKHHGSETGAEAAHHVVTASQRVSRSHREAVCTQEKHIGKIPRSLGLATANGETWCCLISLCPLKMSSLNCRLRRIISSLQSLMATVEIHVDWV